MRIATYPQAKIIIVGIKVFLRYCLIKVGAGTLERTCNILDECEIKWNRVPKLERVASLGRLT